MNLSSSFRKQAVKSIYAILLFIFAYLVLAILVVSLAALCLVGALALISSSPSFVTLGLGLGLISLGVMIVVFLFKFIFETHKVDRSHLIEITQKEEPELFRMISEIVAEIGTQFPKKIYLSAEVNAAVFYDSGFWSMFLPIKKNLQIGVGLINTVSRNELKAILSHEFGHFSQRSMKIGSYVYNVNQIIFNILYKNDSYNNMTRKWAGRGWIFGLFVLVAVNINSVIQWILGRLYGLVNKSYLGLSREMEFHADEIAAGVTGYEPLKNSLIRIPMADNALSYVIDYYNGESYKKIRSQNIYSDQMAILDYWIEINNLQAENGLPMMDLNEQSKFDKSKLVIRDQWASHPPLAERIARMQQTGLHMQSEKDTKANEIFVHLKEYQEAFTNKVFDLPDDDIVLTQITREEFIAGFRKQAKANSFSRIYNRYYDNKNPLPFDIEQQVLSNEIATHEELFSDQKVDLVYTFLSLQSDVRALKSISTNEFPVKIFHYDGIRYRQKDAGDLAEKLKGAMMHLSERILENDIRLFHFFKQKEAEQSLPENLVQYYRSFFAFDKEFDTKNNLYVRMYNGLQFISATTPYEVIKHNLQKIKQDEDILKQEIKEMLNERILQPEITPAIRENFEKYITEEWIYFDGQVYLDDNLSILFGAINNYSHLLSRKYFLIKKELLDYQESLIKPMISTL